MAGLLDRLSAKLGVGKPGGQGGSLAARLDGYAPYEAPFTGPPSRWSLDQARANLDYLLAQRDARLAQLARLLDGYGISIEPALQGGDPEPMLEALHAWANNSWPALHDPRLATRERWLASRRTGAEIVYSLLMDVALLLGELIARRRAAFRWALDLDEQNGRDGMTSFLRPVLLAARPDGTQVELDVEEIVVTRYLQPRNPSLTLLNGWRQLVADAVAGAYEAPLPR